MATADPRAKIVQALLERHGLSFRWLAKHLDVSHVTVTSWLNGEKMPRDRGVWERMIEVLRNFERSQRESDSPKISRAGMRRVYIYPGLSAGPMGRGVGDMDQIEVPDLGTDRDWWGRRIEGFSMTPLLEPGDIVVFEDRPWEPGHVVHAFLPDDNLDTVKVARGRPGHHKVELLPVNEDYDWVSVLNVEVRGVAIMRIRFGPNDERTITEYPHGMRHVS